MNSLNKQYHPYQQRQQKHLQPTHRSEPIMSAYKMVLSELTFNSKPIITKLTIMAQENQVAAQMIVKTIDSQLRSNPAGQKLPVLYLIDSICKNIGGPYLQQFAKIIVNAFLNAYHVSDLTVKGKFERVLQTWKNGMPGGHPVFPSYIIESIENNIRPKPVPHQTPSSRINTNTLKHDSVSPKDPRRQNSPATTITNNSPPTTAFTTSLLSQLQTVLTNSNTKNTLNTNNTASSNELINQIVKQIKALLPTLPASQAKAIEQYMSQIAPTAVTLSPPTFAAPITPTPSLPIAIASNTKPAPVPQQNTSDLIQRLASMGYLPPSPPPQVQKLESDPFKDLHVPRPGAIEQLYSALPLQCKQCGLRFSESGQSKMAAHLDAHFRHNRQKKEISKRKLSRSWFVNVDEWVSGEGNSGLTSMQSPVFSQEQSNRKDAQETVNFDEMTVIKPLTDDNKPCRICGESFVQFWNDDEEEWMYRNAVMVNDTISHATCYADVNKNNKRKLDDQGEIGKVSKLRL